MKARFSVYILSFLILVPLCSVAQNFDDMVAAMTPQSLPQINIEFAVAPVSDRYVSGTITVAEYGKKAFTHYCQLKLRGQTALYLPKKSYNVKLIDDQGESLDDNLLGLRNDNNWILDAMAIDKMRMRNRVIFDIWNEYSHTMWNTNYGNRNGTVGTMVEVYLNGSYNGIYCLSDKVNRKLLNLRKAKENSDGTVTVKGLLYKGINHKLSDMLLDYEDEPTEGLTWNSFELQHPDDYPSLSTWQPLMDMIDFNGKSDDLYFREHYKQWYYVDNLIDYWILLVAFGLDDMPYKNTFLSTPDINFEHCFMLTPWDLDASLGRSYDGTLANYTAELDRLDYCGPFNRIIQYNIDGYKNKVARRWLQLVDAQLSPANFESHIRAIAQRYVDSGAWGREAARWPDYNIRVNANINTEINYIIRWYNNNITYITAQLQSSWLNAQEDVDTISVVTITRIYNYILGIDSTYDEKIDFNHDGQISTNDVTIAYTIMMN